MHKRERQPLASPGWNARQRRIARIGLWTGIIALGANERGALGALAVLYGVDRLAYALSGRALGERLLAFLRRWRGGAGSRRFGDGTRDLVEESSWESFPASDPPGRGVG